MMVVISGTQYSIASRELAPGTITNSTFARKS
jgi:hypothetical protein